MFVFNKAYRNQLLAMLPAYLISICGGMHLAYGIYNLTLGLELWMVDFEIAAIAMVPITFHIMTIIGGTIGAFVYDKTHISKLHFLICLQMILASIIFMTLPTNFFAIIGVRLLAGFAFGCSYLTSIMYASEISSPAVRAQNLFLLHFFITFGMFLHASFTASGVFYLMGSISIVLIIIAMPLSYFKTLPSPVYLMQKNSKDIIERNLYFSNQETVTDKMHLELATLDSHVQSENARKFNFSSYHNSTANLIVIFTKIGYLAVFNIVHNYMRSLFMRTFLLEFTEMIALAARLAGAICGFFLLDRIARRWHFSVPLFTTSIILLIFGSLLVLDLINYIWMPLTFFLPLEFLIGIGIGGTSEILKAEIFPFCERKASLAFTYFVEEIVHIFSIIIHYSYVFALGANPSYWPFVFAALAILSGLLVVSMLRDSRGETWKEIAEKYSPSFNKISN